MSVSPSMLRHLRPVAPLLASYFRPLKRDVPVLANLAAEDQHVGNGVVLGAHCVFDISESLQGAVAELRNRDLDLVLDPMALELAMPGGAARASLASLPWAPTVIDGSHRLVGWQAVVDMIAEQAVESGVTTVLAPSHFIGRGVHHTEQLMRVDADALPQLRSALDAQGGRDIAIHSVVSGDLVSEESARLYEFMTGVLASAPVDGVFLRVHSFGTMSSGPLSLRRYVQLNKMLHETGLPIVGDYTGTVGVALLALGGLGGITNGITMNEGFSVSGLRRAPKGSGGFALPPRVYLASVGCLVGRTEAREVLQRRGMRGHICQGFACCPRGLDDMLKDPRRHYVVRRAAEVAALSGVPDALRSDYYMENWLRPASDRATQLMNADERYAPHRKRLDQWRATIATIIESDELTTRSPVPVRRPSERRRAADG